MEILILSFQEIFDLQEIPLDHDIEDCQLEFQELEQSQSYNQDLISEKRGPMVTTI